MTKLTKRAVDATEIKSSDYVMWDKELPGLGLRVFRSGKRSYVVQYRTAGRSRRITIGPHGVWTPEEASARRRFCSVKSHEAATPQMSASSIARR